MRFPLTLSQQRASDAIRNRVLASLKGDQDKKHTTFYAMTGAGKTIVMADAIESIVKAYKENIAFMWISPGYGSLHIQSFDKLRNSLNKDIKCTILDKTIRGMSHISKNEVAVVNWEKVSKKDNVLLEDGDHIGFLSICGNTKEMNKLCLIIDESHKNQTANTSSLVSLIDPDVTVSMSATPLQKPNVRIPYEDLIAEEVIKKRIEVNYGVTEFKEENTDIDNLHVILECAYKLHLQLKEALLSEGSYINPAMLVQVSNGRGGNGQIELVKEFFRHKEVTESAGNLAVWVTKVRKDVCVTDVALTTPGFDKKAVTDDDSPIDVLIFKQAISTGWDCPRAYIWVKLRDNMNTIFEIQTVGRISRQLNRTYFDNEILNAGYVFTDDMNFEVKNSEYALGFINWLPVRLKEGISLTLNNYYRKWDDRVIRANTTNDAIGFQDVLIKTFNKKFGIVDKDFYRNLDMLKESGYSTSAGILESWMIGDSVVDASEIAKGEFRAGGKELKGKASSTDIIGKFEDFVLNGMSVCGIAKNSYANVRGALIRWAKEYLGFSHGTHLDPLYSFFIRNRINFSELLIDAIESYKVHRAKDKENKLKIKPIMEDWSLKLYHQFNDDNYEKVQYSKYAYDKCYLNKGRSKIEKIFADHIDINENVDWWYKNMDGGREHFSVPYEYEDKYCLFYVDFIAKLKNGTIFIADTKEGITLKDEAPAKSRGLQKYIQEEQLKGTKIVGGIITRNKLGKLKIWTEPSDYKLSDMLDDWKDLDSVLNT